MCGRFALDLTAAELGEIFGVPPPWPNFPPRYNAAPTQSLPIVRYNEETRRRQLDPLRWGLVPIWAKDLAIGSQAINARSETINAKPMFRDAFTRRRRCLVPMRAYYEWSGDKGAKQAHAFGLADGGVLAVAGLWERWKDPASGEIVRSFCVITCPANEMAAQWHDRMPAILPRADWPTWLGENAAADSTLLALLQPYPADQMTCWPVSPAVGNVRNEGAELLAAVGEK